MEIRNGIFYLKKKYYKYFKRLLLKLNVKYSKLGRPATFHCLKGVAVENFKYG
jgi:hypothetical protein